MLAFAVMATIRHHTNQPTPQKTLRRLARTRQASSAGRSRRFAASRYAWHNDISSRRTSSPGQLGDGLTKLPCNAYI